MAEYHNVMALGCQSLQERLKHYEVTFDIQLEQSKYPRSFQFLDIGASQKRKAKQEPI
jgi:hypothetical protein